MTTGSIQPPASTHPRGRLVPLTIPDRLRRRWLGLVAVFVAAALIAAVVVVATMSRVGPSETETAIFTRGQLADIARLEGMAGTELSRQGTAGQSADAARWTAQAEAYEQGRRARADAAATARLAGLAREFVAR
jgi:hypothetical protein